MTMLFTRGLRAAAVAVILFAAPGGSAVQAQGTLAEAAQVERGKLIAKRPVRLATPSARMMPRPMRTLRRFVTLGSGIQSRIWRKAWPRALSQVTRTCRRWRWRRRM
ncbi:hypothetical protein V6L77_02720 [Pannonibacter sp. Pt2-lr]